MQQVEFLITKNPGRDPERSVWGETAARAAKAYNYALSREDQWYGLYVRTHGQQEWTYYAPEHTYTTRGEKYPVPTGLNTR